jgi:hypothetical protein
MGRKSTINTYLGKTVGGIVILDKKEVVDGRLNVKCKCLHCRKEFIAQFHNVYRGGYKSCGCLQFALNTKNPRWKGHGEISQRYFHNLKSGAEKRNIKFQITIQEIWDLFIKQNRKCVLSGRILTFPKRDSETNYSASLDRINSSLGYEKGNIQWVHRDVNFSKQQMNNNQFLTLIKEIYGHNFK